MAENINITYDLLFDILRYEKSREELQALDANFFKNLIDYLQVKDALLINSQTPVSERELTRIQLNNVKKILTELYERREKKLINLALYKLRTGTEVLGNNQLLEEEKIVFDNIYFILSKYRASILKNILDGKLPFAEKLDFENVSKDTKSSDIHANSESDILNVFSADETVKSIRFVKSVPKFLGPELEIYGPFEEQDMASLPTKIADILIKRERAEEVRTD